MIRALLMGVVLMAQPVMAGPWRVAETANFRVYSDGSATALAEQAAILEDYRELLETLTTKRPEGVATPKLDIFLVSRLAEARPFGDAPANAAGFYSANQGRIAAFAEREGLLGMAILLHEYAHHFMLARSAAAYPVWYVEGFAEYFMTAEFAPNRISYGKFNENRAASLVQGSWLPLEKILVRDYKSMNQSETAKFYAQSWLLTHYMFRAEGMQPKLIAYLKAVAGGTDSLAAFKQNVDPDLKAFQRSLRGYLESRKLTYSRFDRSPQTPAAVKVAALPPGGDPMLLQLVALEFGVKRGKEASTLATVRADAARFPDSALAQRTLAFAELRYGDRAVAARQIDTLLEKEPADPSLLRWRALASLPLTRPMPDDARRGARKLLVKAFAADPNDWRTLLLYTELAEPFRRPLSENELDVLLRARELAPQVESISVMTAVALARADRLDTAATVLEPIAYAPHGGALSSFAARAMALAKAGDKPGFLAMFDGPPPEAE